MANIGFFPIAIHSLCCSNSRTVRKIIMTSPIMNKFSDTVSKSDERETIKVFSLVKGFHGGVARYTALLSKLNEKPGIDFKIMVINCPDWLCNNDDLVAYNLDEIKISGRLDFSWIKPCAGRINSFDPDLLFVHGGFYANGLAWLLQRKVKRFLPYVSSYHGYYTAPKLNRKPIEPFLNWATPKVYQNRALAIVSVADYCKRYLVSRGVDKEKITVVHNGIDPDPPQCAPVERSSLGLANDDIIIGVISRFDPVKGLTYLLDAVSGGIKKNPKVHLVMVGDGECSELLQKQCLRLGIGPNVHFVGYQKNVQAWFELFDIFALPSLAEFHSISLLEAMRAGKAIIATDVGGNTESVRDGKEAIIVPPKNAEALECAIVRLIEDPELANRMAEAARERFRKHFTVDVMLDKTEAWLRKCVQLAHS